MKKKILKEINEKIIYLEDRREKGLQNKDYVLGAINELTNLKHQIELGFLDD